MKRPWLHEGADTSDYFNYGLNEQTFLQFINEQVQGSRDFAKTLGAAGDGAYNAQGTAGGGLQSVGHSPYGGYD